MKQRSRIQNAMKNVGVAGILQILTLILSFASRTFFVKLLGNDYLSCEGLFSNILTILSFSELGIGSAIIYGLYQPIAKEDELQICKLMNLYRTAYHYIAAFITIVGLAMIPFLDILITDVPDVKERIEVLYVLFLANTVASYIFGYKRTFLIANQENYLVLLVQQGIHVFKILIQICFLYLTHDYVLFLQISIGCTLVTNVITTIIADRKYPWLNQYKNQKLTKCERKTIFANISAIVQYKLGSVVLNGTDNIIIAVVLKTSLVGVVSNYNLVISTITTIVNQACNGLQATIGNHTVVSTKEKKKDVFDQLFFLSYWVIGFCSVCLAILLNPFVGDVWIGSRYVLANDVVIALCLSFYITMINTIPYLYRMSLGLFQKAKMCPIYAACLNIALSVILGKMIGLAGIFYATAISRFFTYNLMDPFFIFKYGFEDNPRPFYFKMVGFFLLLCINYFITGFVVHMISLDGPMGFVVKCVACGVISNLVFLVAFIRTKMFGKTISTILSVFRSKRGR